MAFHKNPKKPGPEYELVYAAFVRLRNGRVLYARDYGLKAFVFWAKPRR
ncbi:MAG: hypothetical protein AB7G17_08205 [Phycisphaerales bacterium]